LTEQTPNWIDENIENWTDEQCLENFVKFLGRVKMSVELTQNQEGGAYTGKQIYLICGNLMIESDTVALDWPLMMVPAPDGIEIN
jgi:hypothetical protein